MVQRKSKGSVATPQRNTNKSPKINGKPSPLVNGSAKEVEVKKIDDVDMKAVATPLNGSAKKASSNTPLKTLKARLEESGNASPKNVKSVEEKKPEKAAITSRPASGDSMAVQLTQGIMANDSAKLDTVLAETNLNVIQATLADLQVCHVVPLLKAIERRLRDRSMIDVRSWIRWAQCTFSAHMSYLVSLTNVEEELGSLLEWMRARAGHMQRLMALHGKLSVLVEQIERRTNTAVDSMPQPIMVFNNDESEASSDDDMSSIGSDEEGGTSDEEDWWDEGDIGGGDGEEDDDDDDDDESDDDDEMPTKRKFVEGDADSDDDSEEGDDDDMEVG